ncbi:MAG: 50S ribosomal protein L10 [Thermoanaerobaculum sp.]|nr:50S ribosomal protein L10 [Thermoanaerobaculum sp.]
MLTREQKEQQLQGLKAALVPASGLFVMDFSGLTVAEVTELRRKVKEVEGSYVVVKNTLARIALAGSAKEPVTRLFVGPTAVAYTSKDVVALAKVLAEFAKGHEKLKFRGALVEGQLLDAAGAQQVANLPSKQELVARLLYLLQSPMRRLVVALNWPVKSLAVTLKQIAEKEQQN